MRWNVFRLNLRTLRRERGITQADVAETLNVDRVTYARYETGERKPSVDVINTLAEFFNTSIDRLLGVSKKKGKKR
jgi:transcriptional regulator with XRE-family HTH domain